MDVREFVVGFYVWLVTSVCKVEGYIKKVNDFFSAYLAICFFSVSVEEHILLNLNPCLYGILCLRCGGCAEVQCRYGCVSVGF